MIWVLNEIQLINLLILFFTRRLLYNITINNTSSSSSSDLYSEHVKISSRHWKNDCVDQLLGGYPTYELVCEHNLDYKVDRPQAGVLRELMYKASRRKPMWEIKQWHPK